MENPIIEKVLLEKLVRGLKGKFEANPLRGSNAQMITAVRGIPMAAFVEHSTQDFTPKQIIDEIKRRIQIGLLSRKDLETLISDIRTMVILLKVLGRDPIIEILDLCVAIGTRIGLLIAEVSPELRGISTDTQRISP